MLVDTFHPFSAPDRPPARRRAGLTPKPHHAQQPRVALRGSFRLRLASTCNHRPARDPWGSVLRWANMTAATASVGHVLGWARRARPRASASRRRTGWTDVG